MEKKVGEIIANRLCDKLSESIENEPNVFHCQNKEIDAIQIYAKLEESCKDLNNHLNLVGPLCLPFDVTQECQELDLIFSDIDSCKNFLESRFEILKDF